MTHTEYKISFLAWLISNEYKVSYHVWPILNTRCPIMSDPYSVQTVLSCVPHTEYNISFLAWSIMHTSCPITCDPYCIKLSYHVWSILYTTCPIMCDPCCKMSYHVWPILHTKCPFSHNQYCIQGAPPHLTHTVYKMYYYVWPTHTFIKQLLNIPSLSDRSPSTLHSSKTITIRIRHPNLCHPSCQHKNVWRESIFFRWPIY